MTNSVNIQAIYDSYIAEQNKLNRDNRYKGKEEYYHASSAGGCLRKLYFESILVSESTNDPSKESYRKMRLGTVFHSEMEDCFSTGTGTLSIPSNSTSTNSTSTIYSIHQEKEILIKDLNVRGFYDLVLANDETGEVFLYDFKTIGSFPYKLKFGRNAKPNKSKRYELQLGTYGMAIAKEFGNLSGMFLVYYNKDTSIMKQVVVPMYYVDEARKFWEKANKEHSKGLPSLKFDESPVESWECNYCRFKDLCDRS